MSRPIPAHLLPLLLLSLAASAPAQTWTPQSSGTANPLSEAWFTGPLAGWAVGDAGTSIFTNDGGATWNATALTAEDLGDVSFAGSSIGLIVGDNGVAFRTVNAGVNWLPVATGTGSNLRAVAFGGSGVAYAAGRDGVIVRSTDQGASWLVSETGVDRYQDVAAVSARAWIVGDGGVIRATTDGGGSWFSQNSGTASDLKGVHFVSQTEGWAAGQNSTLIYTADGGTTWSPRSTGILVGLDAVFFVDSDLGWAVGNGGAIFRSTNGGLLWIAEASGTANPLSDVVFVGAGRGWAVGDAGTVLARFDPATGTPGPLAELGPAARLSVSPNPFRSFTEITYSIGAPGSGPVTIGIYDSAGRLLRRLDDVVPSAGTGRQTWDGRDDRGSRVASGVYFVRVQRAERAETRKLALIR